MLLEVLQSITGVFVVVYDGQHALKFTLGRVKGVVGPGVHFKLPIVQKFRVEETKDTTLDLEPQTIQLKDDLVYEVGAKVVYQIVDLAKALIEVDDLQEGLKNRLVLAVQKVVNAQDRTSIREMDAMIDAVRRELAPVEEQWGIQIHEFGFSTFSPSPETLEVTQLQRLAEEKLDLFQRFRREGLSEQAAVSLISGAVVAVPSREAARLAAQEENGHPRPEDENARPAPTPDQPSESGANEVV